MAVDQPSQSDDPVVSGVDEGSEPVAEPVVGPAEVLEVLQGALDKRGLDLDDLDSCFDEPGRLPRSVEPEPASGDLPGDSGTVLLPEESILLAAPMASAAPTTSFAAPQVDEPLFEEPHFEEHRFDETLFEEPHFEEPHFEERRFEEPRSEQPLLDGAIPPPLDIETVHYVGPSRVPLMALVGVGLLAALLSLGGIFFFLGRGDQADDAETAAVLPEEQDPEGPERTIQTVGEDGQRLDGEPSSGDPTNQASNTIVVVSSTTTPSSTSSADSTTEADGSQSSTTETTVGSSSSVSVTSPEPSSTSRDVSSTTENARPSSTSPTSSRRPVTTERTSSTRRTTTTRQTTSTRRTTTTEAATTVSTTAPPPANLSLSGSADGSSRSRGASYENVRDGDTSTFWSPLLWTGRVTISWREQQTVSSAVIVETSAADGRVGAWRLRNGDTGATLASGSDAGTVTFDPVSLRSIDLVIDYSWGKPEIAEFEVYG